MSNILADIWGAEDLRKRVLFTLGMIGVYRLGIFVPAPGIDRVVLGEWFAQQQGTLLGMYNMFSGGALEQFSVFVLGIMPYITASIVIQILGEMLPVLRRLKDEGQSGRNKLNQYSRYLCILIALVQAGFMSVGMEQMIVGENSVVLEPGFAFRMLTMLTMTSGSCFIMWLGEQVTERGVGNGSSVLISAGIVAGLPASASQMFDLVQRGQLNLLSAALLLVFMFVVVMGIVFMERGQRRVPLQYAKRVLGSRVYDGQTDYLPLKVNTAGVIPAIFTSSLLMFPGTIGQFYDSSVLDWVTGAFSPGRWLYNVSYAGLVMFFAFFYTAISFKPEDIAENLQRHNGYIPSVRPGGETASYLDWILTRLTVGGAVYLAVVCLMPTLFVSQLGVPFYFGGTGILIIVGVALDTVSQIESHLNTRHYDVVGGPKGRVKGRRRMLGSGGSSEG